MSKRAAVIDIGSENLRMKIAESDRERDYHILEHLEMNLSLGKDSYRDGFISAERLSLLLQQLSYFRDKLNEYKITELRVLATSALREAENRDIVRLRVEQILGTRLEILTNEEERDKQLLALRRLEPCFSFREGERAVLLEIGAGSTQVSALENGRIYFSQNVSLGNLRLAALFEQFSGEKRQEELLEAQIRQEWTELERLHRKRDVAAARLFVQAAPLKNLFRIYPEKRLQKCFAKDEFFVLCRKIYARSELSLAKEASLSAEALQSLKTTLRMVELYLQREELKDLIFCTVDLADAALVEAFSGKRWRQELRTRAEEDLFEMAEELRASCLGDEKHSAYVEATLLLLFKALRKRFDLTKSDERILRLAARLHDIGKSIDLRDHAHYSCELVERLSAFSLEKEEGKLLRELIRTHSGSDIPGDSRYFASEETLRLRLLKLLGLFRVADALDASMTQEPELEKVQIRGGHFEIYCKNKRSLAYERLCIESKGKLFKEVYGLELDLFSAEMKPGK